MSHAVAISSSSALFTKTKLVCLFVLLLYVPSFLGKLEQAVNQYFVHILSLVTDNNPS